MISIWLLECSLQYTDDILPGLLRRVKNRPKAMLVRLAARMARSCVVVNDGLRLLAWACDSQQHFSSSMCRSPPALLSLRPRLSEQTDSCFGSLLHSVLRNLMSTRVEFDGNSTCDETRFTMINGRRVHYVRSRRRQTSKWAILCERRSVACAPPPRAPSPSPSPPRVPLAMAAEMSMCQSAISLPELRAAEPGIGIIVIGGTLVLLVHASATRAYAREMTVPDRGRHLPCHPRSLTFYHLSIFKRGPRDMGRELGIINYFLLLCIQS